MPRDLNDPEGWRFSSLRKMRLERDQFGEDGDVVGRRLTSLRLWREQRTRSKESRSRVWVMG